MRVILLQDVRKVGKRGEVKDVPDGYAKNFLLSRGMARAATKEAVLTLEKENRKVEEEKGKHKEKARREAEAAKGMMILIKAKAGEKGELFGSISEKEILKELEKTGIRVKKVFLENHIKKLGEYEAEADFGEGEKTRIKVMVEKE